MAIAKKFGLWASLACGVALAQNAPGGNAPSAPIVRLTVTAVDADGQGVTDLKADSLTVTDQNKPQHVLFFRRNEGIPASEPLAPHEFTNRRMEGAPNPTVILVDLMNQSQADQINTWHKLTRDLPKLKTGEATFLYILTLEGTLQAIHPMGVAAADDKTWPQQVGGPLDKAMKNLIHAPPSGIQDEEKVKKTYVALETLANQLAAYPGRRNIVWITDQIPNVSNPKTTCSGDWVECSLYVPHLSVTLDHNSVAVNPLAYSPSPSSSRDMDFLAGLTGGRRFSEEDIDKVVDTLAKEAPGTYTLAYELSGESGDSTFRRVRVSTDQKVRLFWKGRYYSMPDQRPAQARAQAAALGAFQAPHDLSEIGLRAIVTPTQGNPKAVHLEIKIDGADLMFRESSGKFTGGVVLLLSDRGANGPLGDPVISNFTLNLTPEQKAAAMKGIPVGQDHPVKDGTQKVRIIVLDTNSNQVGSLTVPMP